MATFTDGDGKQSRHTKHEARCRACKQRFTYAVDASKPSGSPCCVSDFDVLHTLAEVVSEPKPSKPGTVKATEPAPEPATDNA